MQLERILQRQGFGSRKECRALIRRGRVAVAGEVCRDPFREFETGDGTEDKRAEDTPFTFEVDGVLWQFREFAYLMLNKPPGSECSHRPSAHQSVFSLLPPQLLTRGVQCVGRLDQDTTGLLLFSDDGQFLHACASGKRKIPKTYRVRTSEPVADEQLVLLRRGILLHGETQPITALAVEMVKIPDGGQGGSQAHELSLTIGEGKYHQVKRMIAAVGNHVEALCRVAVGELRLPADLEPGGWRWLDPEDFERLGVAIRRGGER